MYMTTEEIINKHLDFLIKDYNFTYEYRVEYAAEWFVYKNANGYFEYYEGNQFDEQSSYTIMTSNVYKRIFPLTEYPDIYREYKKSHRGIKWWFKDIREEYWAMIAKIIKTEIETKHSIFGLEV